MKKIRIIYADDHVQFRKAVVSELRQFNIMIMAEAGDGRELLAQLHRHPDVVLLDLQMPVMNGNQCLEQIVEHWPGTKVIIVSMHYEAMLVENYLQRGAKGYIPKDAFAGNIELLVEAINKVARGEEYIHAEPPPKQKFTHRQKELIPLLLEGQTNKDISTSTGIAERSVEKQRQKLYTKVGGEKAVDFYRYAFARGLQFLGKAKGK